MKKTNVLSINKYLKSEFPDGNVFENTDEHGAVEIIFFTPDGCMWSISISAFNILKESLNNESEPLEVKQLEQNKVTEDFALKLIAMISNKEKFNELG